MNLAKENQANINRSTGIDLVKTVAVIFVVCVHFYLSCGYYSEPLISTKMYIMTYFRWLFMISVPLFMILTGYLKGNKTVSKAHYLSLIPIIITYFIICIIRMLIENKMYGKIHTLDSAVKSLFNYQSAWYVGMYISLMLICPFLNKLWKSLDKKEHNLLICSLVFVSMLYPVVLYVAPSYWQMLYPIGYYYMGLYIKTYKPKINKFVLVILALASTLFNAVVSIYFAKGGMFRWEILGGVDSGYNLVTLAIGAVAIFLIFYDIEIKNSVIKKIIQSIAGCSLEIYLFQTAVNAVIYTYVGRHVSGAPQFFWLFFVLTPISLVLSWIAGVVVKCLVDKIYNIFKEGYINN